MRPDEGDHSGYNEAVDIWSVGCLAGTLLTNTFLFPRERTDHSQDATDDEPTDLQVAFSLQFLDTSIDWKRASGKCKSFIRGCAMVNDSQRLTVAQALQHPWVAHSSFAAAMHAEYARAIADWRPRTNISDLIEYVKAPAPSAKASEAELEARLHQEVRSHHFPSEPTQTFGQFRSYGDSAHTGNSHQSRLSPIDESLRVTTSKPTEQLSVAASDGDVQPANSIHNEMRPVKEDMSYLSIYDYAPPVIYPTSPLPKQNPLKRDLWEARLAESMDMDRPSTALGGTSLHKKVRV